MPNAVRNLLAAGGVCVLAFVAVAAVHDLRAVERRQRAAVAAQASQPGATTTSDASTDQSTSLDASTATSEPCDASNSPSAPSIYSSGHSTPSYSGTSYRPSEGYSSSHSSGPVQVKGYYRRDGTYVQPHTRSRPRH